MVGTCASVSCLAGSIGLGTPSAGAVFQTDNLGKSVRDFGRVDVALGEVRVKLQKRFCLFWRVPVDVRTCGRNHGPVHGHDFYVLVFERRDRCFLRTTQVVSVRCVKVQRSRCVRQAVPSGVLCPTCRRCL